MRARPACATMGRPGDWAAGRLTRAGGVERKFGCGGEINGAPGREQSVAVSPSLTPGG